LIKYIKSVLWRVAKRLSYIEEARCLKVNIGHNKYITKTMHYNVYDVFYSQFPQQHVSAAIATIFRTTKAQMWLVVSNCPTRCDYIQFYYIFCRELYTFRM